MIQFALAVLLIMTVIAAACWPDDRTDEEKQESQAW